MHNTNGRRSWFARHKVLTGLGVFAALGIIGSAVTDDGEQTPTATPSTARPSATAPAAPAAEPEYDRKYVAALEAIDRDIVHGKPDKAQRRGENVCTALESATTRDAQIAAVELRFTSPDHPTGFGTAKAERILAVTVEHLCPERELITDDASSTPPADDPINAPNVDAPRVDIDRPRSCSHKWWC